MKGKQPTGDGAIYPEPPDAVSAVKLARDPMERIADALERLAAHVESKREPLRKG